MLKKSVRKNQALVMSHMSTKLKEKSGLAGMVPDLAFWRLSKGKRWYQLRQRQIINERWQIAIVIIYILSEIGERPMIFTTFPYPKCIAKLNEIQMHISTGAMQQQKQYRVSTTALLLTESH